MSHEPRIGVCLIDRPGTAFSLVCWCLFVVRHGARSSDHCRSENRTELGPLCLLWSCVRCHLYGAIWISSEGFGLDIISISVRNAHLHCLWSASLLRHKVTLQRRTTAIGKHEGVTCENTLSVSLLLFPAVQSMIVHGAFPFPIL